MKNWFFSQINFKLIGLSIALLVLAYVLLAQGPVDNPLSLTYAPILLVVVYCGLLPLSILVGSKSKTDKSEK
jgi:hypothetical protein